MHRSVVVCLVLAFACGMLLSVATESSAGPPAPVTFDHCAQRTGASCDSFIEMTLPAPAAAAHRAQHELDCFGRVEHGHGGKLICDEDGKHEEKEPK